MEFEIKNTIPFTLGTKKSLGINLKKYVQDLCKKNCKYLDEEI